MKPVTVKKCLYRGCDRVSHCRGLCLRCYKRERYQTDPKFKKRACEQARTYRLGCFGLTRTEYETLLKQQCGRCGICGKRPSRTSSLHVDHNHSNNTLRGLLCSMCNQGLGLFQDDPKNLRKALKYLSRQRGKQDIRKIIRRPHRKLTARSIRRIRRLVANGILMSHVAREYGVHWNTIKSVVLRITWAHIA
jgi:hypothetical protein